MQDAEKKRSDINSEALALSLAYTNAIFLFIVVALTFWVMRYVSLVRLDVSSVLYALVV